MDKMECASASPGEVSGEMDTSSDKNLMMACVAKIAPDGESLSGETRETLNRCYELARTLIEISHLNLDGARSPLEEGEEYNFEDHKKLEGLNRKVNLLFSLLVEFQRRMVAGVLDAKKKSREERKKMDELSIKRQKLEYQRDYLKHLIVEFNLRETDYQGIELSPGNEMPSVASGLTPEKHDLIKQKLCQELDSIKSNIDKSRQLAKKRSQALLEKRVQIVELVKIKKELDSIHKSISSLNDNLKLRRGPDLVADPAAETLPYPLFTLYLSSLGCRSDLPFNINVSILSDPVSNEYTGSKISANNQARKDISNIPIANAEMSTLQSLTGDNLPMEIDSHQNSADNAVNNASFPYQKHPLKLKLTIKSCSSDSLGLIISHLVRLDTIILESSESNSLRCIPPYSVPAGIFPNDVGATHPNPWALSIVASSGSKIGYPPSDAGGALFCWLQRICGLEYISHVSTKKHSISLKSTNGVSDASTQSGGSIYHSLTSTLRMLHERHMLLSEMQKWIDNLELKTNSNPGCCKDLFDILSIYVPDSPADLTFRISQSDLRNERYNPGEAPPFSIRLSSIAPQFHCDILISIPPNFPDYPLKLSLSSDSVLGPSAREQVEKFIHTENNATSEDPPLPVSPTHALTLKLSRLVEMIVDMQSQSMQINSG